MSAGRTAHLDDDNKRVANADWQHWIHRMGNTVALLAIGGLVLLIASALWVVSDVRVPNLRSAIQVLAFTNVGLFFHAWAWLRLGRDIILSPNRSVAPSSSRTMTVALMGSVLGFAVGWGSLPLTLPLPDTFIPLWYSLMFNGLFAHVPSVFVPVVSAHAAIFLVAARGFHEVIARNFVHVGTSSLLVVGALGLLAQFLFLQATAKWVWLFAGLTGLSYLTIFVGWYWEGRKTGNNVT